MSYSFTIAGRLFFFLFPLLISAKTQCQQLNEKHLPQGITKEQSMGGGWYNEAVAKIEDKEYSIRALDQPGLYGAINHVQHLGYWFNGQGYAVQNFNEDGSDKNVWRTQFVLTGWGRGGNVRNSGLVAAINTSDHVVRMDYRDYSVTYDNERPGMEQCFLLPKKPSGTGRLEIVTELKGDLASRLGKDGQLLLYTAGHPDDIKLTYDQLTVWDRNHKRLPAGLSLEGRRLVLTVDDRTAAYPVTVDPFAHGSSTTIPVNDILGTTLNDLTAHTCFGYSVNGAGDVNGDGIPDIIVGSPLFAQISGLSGGKITGFGTIAATGAAFIYYGSNPNGPSTSPSVVLQPSGMAAGALFGYSVSTIGNAGGTANSGVIVGAPGDQVIKSEGFSTTFAIGKAYVYAAATDFPSTGTPILDATPDLTLFLPSSAFGPGGPNHNVLYGLSVADAGDVNGDGFDDIVVGSPIYNNTGRVDIYYGSVGGFTNTSGNNILGEIAGENFGFSLSSAGDFNDDGISDLVVGAPGCIATASIVLVGHAYVFYGDSKGILAGNDFNARGTAGQTLTQPGDVPGSLFGFSVSTAGDVNNDQIGDLVIGAPLMLTGHGATGNAYVYYGGTTNSKGKFTAAQSTATLSSPRTGSGINLLFGFSVANAGNVTGDVSGDLVIGEPGSVSVSNPLLKTLDNITPSTSPVSGKAYVFAGNSGTGIVTGVTPATTISDPNTTTPNALGYSVHKVGDVDGSGTDDYIIGEPSAVLDLGFNYTTLTIQPGATLEGTLSIGTTSNSNGLLVTGGVGNAIVEYGSVSTLPVVLITFTGQKENNGTLLRWTTAQEQNSSYFEIDRSGDNQNYTAIGQVAAAGNSTQVTDYSFTDGSPLTGNNYYRLKMVNLDGSYVYSQVVVINFGSSSMSAVTAYPNPAHGSFTLLFKNMTPGQYGVSLLSAIGQTVQTTMVQVTNPANDNESINISPGLASGAYFIRVVDEQAHVSVIPILIH
jgi:Secretion system C-terminal sorting domain/FG-GAP repeat